MRRIFHRIACVALLLFTISSFYGCSNSEIIREMTKIKELRWEATAERQEFKSCNESGWEIPEGAVVYKEQEEIKSYKIVGYETKYRTEEYQEKIGYYRPTWRPRYETRTRTVAYKEAIKEPIYATKYYYTIDKWVDKISIHLATGYDKDYDYEEYVCEENERVTEVKYKYLVVFRVDNREISYIVDKERWESLKVGQEITIETGPHWYLKVLWDDEASTTHHLTHSV